MSHDAHAANAGAPPTTTVRGRYWCCKIRRCVGTCEKCREVAYRTMILVFTFVRHLGFMSVMMMNRCNFVEQAVTVMGLLFDVGVGNYVMKENQSPCQEQSVSLYL